jgi:Rieske Fe-S protein
MTTEPPPFPSPATDLSKRRWLSAFLATSIGATVVSFLYPVLRYLIPPMTSEPSLSELELPFKPADLPPNSGKIVPFGGKPILVFRTPAGEIKALTAVCTHLNCTVQYRKDRSDIWCACHNGTYNLDGGNVSGPPPRPLTALVVNVRGDKIVVRKA